MTCAGCVSKVKSELLKIGDVTSAAVQLNAPQATISMQKHISTDQLQQALNKAGNYSITEATHHSTYAGEDEHETANWWQTYKPVLLVGMYITGTTLLIETVNGFHLFNWLNNFMAVFFLIFSLFKLFDLSGFAESYATYDVIAKKWTGWGFIYPFIELLLGLAFIIRINPVLANGATFVIMSISMVGVLQAVMQKRKIQCACLGAVFNLPMSTITILEDALMIAMSGMMLLMSNQ